MLLNYPDSFPAEDVPTKRLSTKKKNSKAIINEMNIAFFHDK